MDALRKIRWDMIATIALVACAITTTTLVIRREFVNRQTAAAPAQPKPLFLDDWRRFVASGVQMGPAEAKVQILEFADFECPYCGQMNSTLSSLRQRFPADVAVTFIHYPLEMHRFAELSARAAECAASQGRFEAMHDVLFANQREFGITPWSDLADQAAVPSKADFEACMKDAQPRERVAEGKRLGTQLNVTGTPTLIVNGWQVLASPDKLEDMVKLALAGKSPVSD